MNKILSLLLALCLVLCLFPAAYADEPEKPVVYFTDDISPAGLVAIYEALNWKPVGPVAVKLSTGEPPASNYLRPELMRLTGDLVGAHFKDYGSYLILSHFKGHPMAGYGGAIKNASIGLASAMGKVRIHSGGTSDTHWHDELQIEFLEAMAEAAKAVCDDLGDQVVFINVMNRLSIDCDCAPYPEEPDIHDIGILASTDPVALDQACLDLVSKADGNEKLMWRLEDRQGLHTLEHAEEIGLGSRSYTLVDIGKDAA